MLLAGDQIRSTLVLVSACVALLAIMSKFQAELAVKMEAELGEGSIWDYRTSCLLWLDIMGATLFRYNPADGTNEAHSLKGFGVATVSSVVPLAAACDPSGDLVGCTTTDGFATYSFGAKTLTLLGGAPPVAAGERFNDGKLDPTGQYWAGTLVRDAAGEIVPSAGSFYKRDAGGAVTKALAGVSISNGLAWTSDAKTMYYIDTPTQQVDAFDYDVATGSLSNRRAAVTGFTGGANGQVDGESSGYPDGCCIDAAGKLWVRDHYARVRTLSSAADRGRKRLFVAIHRSRASTARARRSTTRPTAARSSRRPSSRPPPASRSPRSRSPATLATST